MDSVSDLEGKRITLKRSRPNPLFEGWLEELYEEAKTKKSKLESMLKEALDSLSKYPLPLNSGAECAVLKGFDKKLCLFLDRRIEAYTFNSELICSESESSDLPDAASQNRSENRTASSSTSKPTKRTLPDTASQNRSENGTASSSTSKPTKRTLPDTASQNRSENGTASSSTSKPTKRTLPDTASQNRSENGTASSSTSKPTKRKSANGTNKTVNVQKQLNCAECNKANKKISKARKEYIPVFRSGSYAILVALLEQLQENPANPALQKEKLIEKAQPHSEESFTRPKPESFYTAWSNMSRLVSKGLVEQVRSKKTEYSLTDEGISLAIELVERFKNEPTINDVIFNGASTSKAISNGSNGKENTLPDSGNTSSQSSQATTVTLSQRTVSDVIFVELPPKSFDVILLIDKQEISGNRNKNDPTVAQFNKYPDLKHEYRHLKVGDFTWIARHRTNQEELVLPYIVERKRMDDFGKSVIDGRFHEQKFRLRKCGLKNVIYLVEHFGSNKHLGLPIQSLMQALANTRVQDGFKVHITDSLNNTARFLAMMTKRLAIEYQDKNLFGSNSEPEGEQLMIFNYFNKFSMKNKPLTVTETFIKLLLQLKGVSVDKALAIAKVYSTPKALIKEYERCDQKEGEKLLANLKYGNLNRNVGPMTSKAIHKFFVWQK